MQFFRVPIEIILHDMHKTFQAEFIWIFSAITGHASSTISACINIEQNSFSKYHSFGIMPVKHSLLFVMTLVCGNISDTASRVLFPLSLLNFTIMHDRAQAFELQKIIPTI